VGALLLADIAHPAGLIAAKLLNDPLPHCHIVTSTTHKTLRGPRGGIIMMGKDFDNPWGRTTKKGDPIKMSAILDSGVFPGRQGGPLEHVIAAKAVAFREAATPEFKAYAAQVVKNAQVMAQTLVKRGLRIVSGRTESHVMLVDLRSKGITGKEAEAVLGQAHITVNKNSLPNDPEKPFVTSGVLLGTPAMTTRGFNEAEAELTGNLIADVLDKPRDEANIASVRERVNALTASFPVYR
jgi:glycine hydroxymethyltransferase